MTDRTTITPITTITMFAPIFPGGVDLYALISRDTTLRRTAATDGGEYSAPCPLCRRGTDHFKYWRGAPGRGERWACLGPKAGRSGCDKGGDAIQYLRERDHLTYRQACDQRGIDRTAGVPRTAGVRACSFSPRYCPRRRHRLRQRQRRPSVLRPRPP